MDRIQLLKGVPLFAGLAPPQLEELSRLLQEEKLSPKAVVVRQGERGDRFYLVEEGRLNVSIGELGGGEVTVATLSPGDVFGEMALLGNQPRTATVTTLTPVRLLVMGHDSFERFLTTNPLALRELLRTVATRQQANVAALLQERPSTESPAPPCTIVLASTKGGVGRTTLAVNLAVALRVNTGKRVALVDCNLQFGDVGLLLNLDNGRSVVDLLPWLKEDDPQTLSQVMANHHSGLQVLLAPPRPELADLVTGEHVKTLLQRMSSYFDYTVIDAPPLLQDISLNLFDASSILMIVTAPELASLKDARVLMQTLLKLGYPRERFDLVVNRSDSAGAIRLDDIGRALGCPVAATIANDWKAATSSRNRGEPAVLLDKNSRLARDVSALAQHVVERAAEPKAEAAPKKQ